MRVSIVVLVVGAIGISAIADDPPSPTCYTTDFDGQCGNNQVLSSTSCGGVTCNTKEIVFDAYRTVKTATAGLDDFVAVTCYKTTVTRECVAIPGGYACQFVGTSDTEAVAMGTQASGNTCSTK